MTAMTKTAAAILFTFLSTNALAAHAAAAPFPKALTCENERSEPFSEHVTLKLLPDLTYEISHFGHSRNFFSAIYEVEHSSVTPGGNTMELKKMVDNSTWKNMPQTLVLEHLLAGYILRGLEDIGEPSVYFDRAKCVQN